MVRIAITYNVSVRGGSAIATVAHFRLNLAKQDQTSLCMSYRNIITIEPGKRGGKPCIRRMRITVYDVLGWLAAGMSVAEILDDFPELTEEDIKACLEFAAAL